MANQCGLAARSETLSSNQVHVWIADLNVSPSSLHELRATLVADELARASRFAFARHRDRFTAGRCILREILSRYVAVPAAELSFSYNEYGKPSLDGRERGKISFNLSHSETMAVVGVTRQRAIGIDVEAYRDNQSNLELAATFFSPAEVAQLHALPKNLRPVAFLNCWTRKEAYIKARGQGLSIPLDSFDVSLAPDEPAELLRTADPAERSQWRLRHLVLGCGYVGALAVAGQDWSLALRRWPDSSALADLADISA